ncbi:hypothetical protein XSP_003840 [Xanthomonas euroxanthea]|uniref:Uncharacterized protein n=1 Tax=Xanthomonas euroxanthea TaxID=2259622 RepID=A0A8E4EWU8_9XANT|nr:hypothetical protein [Xanthomonas euroxanthea]CAD1796985.1 hypothetical protein XSP_003840 [Xanthomonas euroxanthea]SYZ54824.1 hypothetical protein CPBF367_23090 [Xanthomonas arboricola pv. juglandis]
MAHTFGDIACIKAQRLPDDLPALTLERMRENQAKGVDTQLIPDTNVVIDMIDAVGRDDPLRTQRARDRLGPLIEFLRECSKQGLTYYFSPKFGLDEMKRGETTEGISLLDTFGRQFGLNWGDAHPEHPIPDEVGTVDANRSFCKLGIDHQLLLSLPFGALLLALVVGRDLASATPLAKFRHFVRLYRRMIDIVSIREITIARFIFAPPAAEVSPIKAVQDNIVRNFARDRRRDVHWPQTYEQLDRTALNGAFDLHLLNVAITSDHISVDEQPLDTWILSADSKLAALTDALHHSSMGTDESGKYFVTQDYCDYGDYWRQTHQDMQNVIQRFRADLEHSFIHQRARAFGVLALAEQGLRGDRPVQGVQLRHATSPRNGEDRLGVLVQPQLV